MSSTKQTVYLIAGTNRGIGKALLATLLLRPNSLVIGTVRNASTPEAEGLRKLRTGEGSQVQIIEMDVSQPQSILSAISALRLDKIDVVLSNAAVSRVAKSVAEVPYEEVLAHFQINTIGSLVLYQATRSLLGKSSDPKMVFFSSVVGSIGIQAQLPFNGTPYNVSKAALNAIGARLAFEEKENLIVVLLHPGVVDTDMIKQAKEEGVDVSGASLLTTQESADKILATVDRATHEDSGKFVDATSGEGIPW